MPILSYEQDCRPGQQSRAVGSLLTYTLAFLASLPSRKRHKGPSPRGCELPCLQSCPLYTAQSSQQKSRGGWVPGTASQPSAARSQCTLMRKFQKVHMK